MLLMPTRYLPLVALLLTSAAWAGDLDADRTLVAEREAERCAMLARASEAVVCIFAEPAAQGGGSGVLFDPRGYGLTNFHVVQEFVQSRQGFGGLGDGRLYRLRVLGIDAGGDIAVFKLEARETFPFMPLADSDSLRAGQAVAALGNPFVVAEDYQPTITYGVISGLHRYQEGQGNLLEYADCIQVSTSINPGNSGGPLIDMQGRVIGINGRASFEERGRVNVGLGYAVTANQIKRFLPGLIAGQFMEHGTLGAAFREIGGRLVVSAVQQLSPAEKAGVQLGDELVRLDGRALRTTNEINNAIAILPADWPVTLRLRRGAEEFETTVRLERLVLPMNQKFVPDLDDNHAALRGLLERARATAGIEIDPAATWCWRSADADEWCLVGDDVDSIEATAADRERRRLFAPLVQTPDLDVNWEWVGGDLVDGQIAAVIVHRPEDGVRATWRLRFEDAALLDVRFADPEGAVTWRCSDPRDFEAGRWPTRLVRTTADGGSSELRIETVTRTVETQP